MENVSGNELWTDERTGGDTYRFGRSQQYFRGPKPDLSGRYVAFLGGSETYGRFVATPFPALLARELTVPCANWGTPDAGPSFYLKDPVILEACSRAELCVVTATDAFATSNRMYTVFPRRNGRLESVSKGLQALYPRVDFGRFAYVRDMLTHLKHVGPQKFEVMEIEIRDAWVARMRELLAAIETTKLLFWMAGRASDAPAPYNPDGVGIGPMMVDGEMMKKIAPHAAGMLLYEASPAAQCPSGEDRMFDDRDHRIAMSFPGEHMHREAAEILFPVLRRMIPMKAERASLVRRSWEKLGLKFGL